LSLRRKDYMAATQDYSARILRQISDVSEADWDTHLPDVSHPFLSWRFLNALEQSGSATSDTGWTPCHIWLTDSDEKTVGAAPLYLKTHSQGEYVFDHGWADALHRAGGDYYPKLQCSVPFTPATGPRLLTHNAQAKSALLKAMENLCQQEGFSSAHLTFLQDDDKGVRIKRLSGDDLKDEHWDVFYQCYIDTGMRKWGRPYLTRSFFDIMQQTMRNDICLIIAEMDDTPIAAALNFIGGDALYGRNWGALVHKPFLHFELCYYQAIEAGLEMGLARVEAGAQGEHKLARGYEPVTTHSAHFIAHPGLRDAISRYLTQERRAVDNEINILNQHTPFKKGE